MNKKMTNRSLGALLLPTLMLTACGDDLVEEKGSIVEVAKANGFSTLVSAIEAAGLKSTLEGEGPFTVFAPSNSAFQALPPGALDALLADTAKLQEVLKYHVVAGRVTADQVVTLSEATTLQGQKLSIRVDAGTVFINDAKVTTTNVEADNGIVHVIDSVLMPKDETLPQKNIVEIAAGNADFSTLVTALQASGLDSALSGTGPFTVFAPTNAAFAALPAGVLDGLLADIPELTKVLKYHVVADDLEASEVVSRTSLTSLLGPEIPVVVNGSTVKVAGATITTTGIRGTNGVIHVIDAVMLPPSIVDLASSNANLSTLVTALGLTTTPDLVEALSGPGPFTVFAPVNSAFAALPEADLNAILADEPQLNSILRYHVVADELFASEVVAATSLTSLQGSPITVEVNGSTVKVDGATVVTTDIRAKNGVIHLIDAVMLP